MSYKWRSKPYDHDIEYHTVLGVVCASFNHIEYAMLMLAREMLGLSYQDQYIILRHFQNTSLAQLVTDLSARHYPGTGAEETIKMVADAFNTMRTNRNLLIHGHYAVDAERSELNPTEYELTEWVHRRPTANRAKASKVGVSVEDMQRFCDEMEDWGMQMVRVAAWVYRKQNEPESAGEVPPLPNAPMPLNIAR